jgi:hypothetical protein
MSRTPEANVLDKDTEIYKEYLSKRRIVGLDGARNSDSLGENWDWVAFKYVNSLLFVPIIYQSKETYLMLGFKEKSSNPSELLLSVD